MPNAKKIAKVVGTAILAKKISELVGGSGPASDQERRKMRERELMAAVDEATASYNEAVARTNKVIAVSTTRVREMRKEEQKLLRALTDAQDAYDKFKEF